MTITDFIICDDVRHEIGGKTTLVGVYQDGIGIDASLVSGEDSASIHMRMAMYIRIKLADNEKPDGFEIACFNDSVLIGKNNGKINYTEHSQIVTLVMIAEQFPLKCPGIVTFIICLKQGSTTVHKAEYPYPLRVMQVPAAMA